MNAPTTRLHEASAAIPPDLTRIKARQQEVWSSGDDAAIGTLLQIVGEELCESLDLRAGQKVLDVAAGNGNVSLAAARRWCEVTSTDYVPGLLKRARERAAAERLDIDFRHADAESLPFPEGSFDVVVSTFGVMFTADQERAANEMMRVCRPGGKIGMANWTPDGFIGHLFKTIARHLPPAAGLKPPSLWGTRERIAQMFGPHASSIDTRTREFVFRFRSAEHWMEVFRTNYGPMLKTFDALDGGAQTALTSDIMELIGALNESGDGTMVVPSTYLEVVINRD
jgi:ubiquinone/menaquinone biosynthesis C-methylase UbiE